MRGEDLNNLSFVEPLLATAGPWVQDYPESSGFLVSTRSGERKAKGERRLPSLTNLQTVIFSLTSVDITQCINMSSAWPEVNQAAHEHRYELVLNGAKVAERIDNGGLDQNIFKLDFLNFLQISNTKLVSLPEDLGNLVHLKTLDLHRNSIQNLPSSIGLLRELKNLDLSGNELHELPSTLAELSLLQTLNLNCNKLTVLPDLNHLKSLSRLDVSHNQLTELPEGIYELEHLSEIHASNNNITTISASVCKLAALKVLSLNVNEIESIPAELSLCHKLKDLNLQDNAIKDTRLAKLIKQCHAKAVLDYIAVGNEKGKGGKKVGKKGRNKRASEGDTEEHGEEDGVKVGPTIKVIHSEGFKVSVKTSVQDIRPYIVCSIVKNLDLTDMATFRKFINIQVCTNNTFPPLSV